MTIEYKIKFDKDGVTITQSVEPNAKETVERSATGAITVKKQLDESFSQTKRASGAVDVAGGGGDRTGTGTGGGDRTGTGTGGGDRTGTGSGASSGRVIGIVFGPLVIMDGDSTGSGGGGADRTHPPN